jgi:dolichyl-phosphate beta-glucosyltransferase
VRHLRDWGWSGEVLPVVDRNQPVAAIVDEVAERHTEVRPVPIDARLGKGGAIQRGMASATGEFRCFIDADNGVSFEQIDGAFELIDRYDIVIGSRYTEGGSHGKRPLAKTIMSRGGNLLFRLILGLDYTDTRAPMKLYREHVAEELFPRLRLPGFGFDTELLFLAKKFGYSVSEYPVSWEEGRTSSVSFRRDAILSILELFQVRWYWLTGSYKR